MNIQMKCQVSTVIHLKFTAKNKIHFSKTRVTFIAIIIIYLLRVALMCILGL